MQRQGRAFLSKPFIARLILVTMVVGLAACTDSRQESIQGEPITEHFLKVYSGEFHEPDHSESYEIKIDGRVKIRYVRQVGQEGTEVPYPTVCTYFHVGQIRAVYKRSGPRMAEYMNYATHLIDINIHRMHLDDSAKQDTPENCRKFISLENRPVSYSIYAELLDEETFRTHTSGGGDYVPNEERTESTLDEVFTKR